MVLYKKRERFNDLSIKIGIAFSKLRLTPNQWTLISVIPVLFSLYFLAQSQFVPAAILLLISAFLDLVDGSVARVTGKTTLKGAYLDTIMDRYIEFIIILGILIAGLPSFLIPVSVWILVYMFGAMMTTYAKAAAKEKGLSKEEIKGGILERAERLIILFVGILLAAIDPILLTYTIVILAILANITAFHRIGIALRKAKD